MGTKDKHKPLIPDRLDSYRVASCAVASRTLLPSTLYLDSAHHPSGLGLWQSEYM